MANNLENNVEPIPAIPPEDYKGSVGAWCYKLMERGLWDGNGWYGDVQLMPNVWWEILEECEGYEKQNLIMRKIHINNDDNYATPPDFYKELDNRFNFDFDPCPYCEGEVVDGLSIEWGKSNFVNPPYSRKLKEAFVRKGVEEMKKGKLCVFLIPVSTSTELYHDWIKPNATEIEFVRGRIKFGKLDKDGNFYLPLNKHGKTQSGTKDSMVVVFDGRSATL